VDGPNLYQAFGYNPITNRDPEGLALYAFDGTWNDVEMPNVTNVKLLWDVYDTTQLTVGAGYNREHLRHYEPGVGTNWWSRHLGGALGLGARLRIDRAYHRLVKNYRAGDHTIDIVGFSRGAAEAREFANVIYSRGIRSEDGRRVTGARIPIRFLGLFDTVAALGIPWNKDNWTYRMEIPPNVQNVRHAVAADERRRMYGLWSIRPEGTCRVNGNYKARWFRGSHSDIGGGYWHDSAAKVALNWMWNEAWDLGVPLFPLPLEHRVLPSDGNLLHDSVENHEPVSPNELERRNRGRRPRRIFYPKGCN
jgi:uncharacterized protein (DUF2235 family)